MAAKPQVTRDVVRLFALLTSDPLAWWWGVELSRELGLSSGTIYPLLARLENARWLESVWEEVDSTKEERPRQRLYRLTGPGERAAAEALAAFGVDVGRRARRSRQRRSAARRPAWA